MIYEDDDDDVWSWMVYDHNPRCMLYDDCGNANDDDGADHTAAMLVVMCDDDDGGGDDHYDDGDRG
jgi:hypothetical protein